MIKVPVVLVSECIFDMVNRPIVQEFVQVLQDSEACYF